MLIASAKNPGARGKHLAMQLLCVTARILVTRVSFIYLVDEVFFVPAAAERNEHFG